MSNLIQKPGFSIDIDLAKIYFENELQDFNINIYHLFGQSLIELLSILMAPLIVFLRTPLYLWKEIINNFYFSNDLQEDEIIGFGEGRSATGMLYFLARAKMAKKFGTFGIAHDDYMGTPVTLHRGPIDVFLNNIIGYRKLIAVAVLVMSFAFIWFAIQSGSYYFLLLLPFIFSSAYFTKHIFVGVTEPLAWSFFLMSLIFYLYGYYFVAAGFFSLVLLTHIGVGLLLGGIVFSYLVLNFVNNVYSIQELHGTILFFILTFIMISWFIIPFIRNSNKLGRNELIDGHYGMAYKWTKQSGIQALVYLVYIISNFIFYPENNINFVLFLPLLVLYINAKQKWLFSQYTVDMFMLIMGALFIFINPRIEIALVYLYLINTSPEIQVPFLHGANRYGFSLKPVTLGPKKKDILDIFSKLPKSSRIALEGGIIKETNAYQNNVLLSYLLVDSEIELFDGYAPEFVEASIYLKMVQYLSWKSSPKIIKNILVQSGSKYIVAYDERFKVNLRDSGFKELSSIDCKSITWVKNRDGPVMTLFEAPFEVTRIEPETKIKTMPNKIIFEAKKDITYFLKYNYYQGWRAIQNGNAIPIEDGEPGMIIFAPNDGEIILEYNYGNYFKPIIFLKKVISSLLNIFRITIDTK